MRRGCWDPVERLADMDIDGVWGSLCFPNFPRFAGTLFLTDGEDKDLALSALQDFRRTVADFSDCLIGRRNRAVGVAGTVTFDRTLKGLEGFRLL